MNNIEQERREIVEQIVSKLDDSGVDITHASVAAKIEEAFPGFAYDAELDDFTRTTAATMAATEAADKIDDDSPDALREKIRALDQRAADLRIEIRRQTDARQTARGLLGQCIADFQGQLGPRITPESNTREFLASQLAERAAHARGDSYPIMPTPGPSKLDVHALYSGSVGDANDFVRASFQTGHRRGSLPASAKGRRIVPSQRG